MFKHDMKKNWSIISETLSRNKQNHFLPETITINGQDLPSVRTHIYNELSTQFTKGNMTNYKKKHKKSDFQIKRDSEEVKEDLFGDVLDRQSKFCREREGSAV